MLQGSYAKERVKGTAEETAERTREAKEAAKERAKEAADRWKGKLRSVVRPSAFVLMLTCDRRMLHVACCIFIWSLGFCRWKGKLRSAVRPSAVNSHAVRPVILQGNRDMLPAASCLILWYLQCPSIR